MSDNVFDEAGKHASQAPVSEQVAWLEKQAQLEKRRDKASRYAEINAHVAAVTPLAVHPRELNQSEIIERTEAETLLGVKAADFSRLLRRGIVRRAHPDLRSQFLYRDVAALALTPAGTPARSEMEKRLRLRNTMEYLSDFSPQAYYDLAGNPVALEDMDYVDRIANQEFQLQLAAMSVKFRSLLRPVAYNERRDQKTDHDVQFLYLAEEDEIPRMTAALEMRKWYAETHPHTQYHVARVAIPPLKMLNRPEHVGVLKFLVQSASILYGIDFEAMPERYYDMITDQQMQIGEGLEGSTLYQTLTGARISDEAELLTLLSSQAPIAAVPLQYMVGAWYQAYHTLVNSDEAAPRFEIRRPGYINELLKQIEAYDTASEIEPADLVQLRRSLTTILGCHDGWSTKFRTDAPPAYIGQPPSYEPPKGEAAEPDPLRVRLHPALRNTHLGRNTSFLMGKNAMEDLDPDHLQDAIEVAEALDQFHLGIVGMVQPASTTKADRIMTARLFALLYDRGIDPRSMYLYPIRDARVLHEKIFKEHNVLLDDVLPSLRFMYTTGESKRKTVRLSDIPELPTGGNGQTPTVTHEDRLSFVRMYATQQFGFSEADIASLSNEEMLESLGEGVLPALDAFIADALAKTDGDDEVLDIEL